MSHPISPQHPAVVLRSHYIHVRALLVVAMVAVVGLTVAVVILATASGGGTATTGAAPVARPAVVTVDTAPGVRYDGGPDEGTVGAAAARHASTIRYDGGPEEGTVGLGR